MKTQIQHNDALGFVVFWLNPWETTLLDFWCTRGAPRPGTSGGDFLATALCLDCMLLGGLGQMGLLRWHFTSHVGGGSHCPSLPLISYD